jgi:hypothetical protein
MAGAHHVDNQANRVPIAPPVYRPQPLPRVLQTKIRSGQQSPSDRSRRQPLAPPVYRPKKIRVVQPKALIRPGNPPTAPPVYRPAAKRIAQPQFAGRAKLKNSQRDLTPRFGVGQANGKHPQNATIQRALADDLSNLDRDLGQTDDHLLRLLYREVVDLADVDIREEPDPKQAHAARVNNGAFLHEVVIDPDLVDPLVRQSFVFHELIHVSADRKYNANRLGEPDHALTATVALSDSLEEQKKEIGRQARYRGSLMENLERIIDVDEKIGAELGQYAKARLERAQGASHQEFDTVLSELYYFFKMKGADESSAAFREIGAMTLAAYRARHQQRPIDEVYDGALNKAKAAKGCCVIM